MTKKELITSITHDLLEENLLNKHDLYDIESLIEDVERVIADNLKDFTIITTSGIVQN
jgi:hypothetical protein